MLCVYKFIIQLKRIIYGLEEPDETALNLTVKFLRMIGLWRATDGNMNDVRSRTKFVYAVYNKFIFALFSLYAITITFDLGDAHINMVDFGDDMCIIIGIYLILFKTIYFDLYSKDILYVIQSINQMFRLTHVLDDILYTDVQRQIIYYRRQYYLQDVILLLCNITMGFLLFVAISLQPFFIQSIGHNDQYSIPLRAKFPFLNPTQSPISYTAVYVFQTVTTLLLIENIVFMDQTGGSILNQTCLQFQLLCLKFQSLNRDNNLTNAKLQLRKYIIEHQKLIKFVSDVNRLFHSMYLAQLVASMMIICLTAFESTLTMHNKTLFFKFTWYMFSSFMQLLYWCWLGNKVSFLVKMIDRIRVFTDILILYFQSTKIENSILNCNWITTDKQFKKDLMFVVQRSQKPVIVNAYPLYTLNFQSFISILSGSYSYYTILRSVYVEEKHPSY